MIGISNDEQQTQLAFSKARSILFPMIGDPTTKISESFGVKWPLTRRAQRVTFVIDGNGIIRGAFHHELAIGRHVTDALESLRRIGEAPHPSIA